MNALKKTLNNQLLLVLVPALLVTAACGGEEPLDDDAIGSRTQALCSASSSQPMQSCGETTAVSADSGYSEQCDGYFAADFTNTHGKTFTIGGGWAEALPTKRTECPYAQAKLRAYGLVYSGVPCSGGTFCFPYKWQLIGERFLRGKWYECPAGSWFCPLQGCYLEPLFGEGPLTQQSSSALRVRVEVQAAHLGYGKPIYKRARTSVLHFDGCIK